MDWLTGFLGNVQGVGPVILVYSVVIAIGMALGRLRVAGISLGVTFVLFAGLALSYLGVHVDPSAINFLRDFGLILFVFFIGLQVGPGFFSSFRSGGLRLNFLALFAILLSLLVTVALFFLMHDSLTLIDILGVHFGAVTNTPGLGAAQAALEMSGLPFDALAVGYACAYPLGVVGIIASTIILRLVFRVDLRAEEEEIDNEHAAPICFHARVTNLAVNGHTVAEIRNFIGRPFICSRLRNAQGIISPGPDTVLCTDDVVRIVANREDEAAIETFLGTAEPDTDLALESSPLVSREIRVTRSAVNGQKLAELHLSRLDGVNITRVYRAGMQLFPHQSLHLQIGDVVKCVGPERAIGRLAGLLGNQEKLLNHPNIIAIFIGIAAGVAVGSLPLAVPGLPVPLKLGLAGGPLIVAILLGYYGPQLHLNTYTTTSANLMMREFGISLFLASVGLSGGPSFVHALLNGSGPLFVGLGLIITMVPLLITGVVARLHFRMNYHTIAGMLAGVTTDPPALAYLNTLSDKGIAEVAYSTVYPLTMFLRILSGQLVLMLLWSWL